MRFQYLSRTDVIGGVSDGQYKSSILYLERYDGNNAKFLRKSKSGIVSFFIRENQSIDFVVKKI